MEPVNTLQVANFISKRSPIWLPRSIIVGIATNKLIIYCGLENAVTKICHSGHLENLQYILSAYFGGEIAAVGGGALLTGLMYIVAKHGYHDMLFELFTVVERYKIDMIEPNHIGIVFRVAAVNNHGVLVAQLLAHMDAKQYPIIDYDINTMVRQTAEHGHREMMHYIFAVAKERNRIIHWTAIKEAIIGAVGQNFKDIISDLFAYMEQNSLEKLANVIGGAVVSIAQSPHEDLLLHVLKYADDKNSQISSHHIDVAIDNAASRGQAKQLGHMLGYAESRSHAITSAKLGGAVYYMAESPTLDVFRTLAAYADKIRVVIPGAAIASLIRTLSTIGHDLASELTELPEFPALRQALEEYSAAHQL